MTRHNDCSAMTFEQCTDTSSCHNCGDPNYVVSKNDKLMVDKSMLWTVRFGYGNMRTRVDLCLDCRKRLAYWADPNNEDAIDEPDILFRRSTHPLEPYSVALKAVTELGDEILSHYTPARNGLYDEGVMEEMEETFGLILKEGD